MSDVEVIKADYELQIRVGKGEVDKDTIEKSQAAIDNNTTEFAPLALKFLERMKEAIDNAQKPASDSVVVKEQMTQTIMELKSNSKMFQYDLVTALANILLGYIEAIDELDKVAIQIFDAHHTTLKAIINKKLKGDGGEYGEVLEKELKDAVKRHMKAKAAKKT